MGGTPAKIEGPDFARGVAWDELADGAVLTGHVADTPALLLRRHDEFFIIGSSCTHYGAPLCEGLVVGDAIRCPWHHAEFNIRDGEVIRAPALDRLPCWQVYVRDGRVFAGEPVAPSRFVP